MRRYLPTIILNTAIWGGLAMIGVGLWWYEPWVSLTVLGFLIFGGAWWSMNRAWFRSYPDKDEQ